MDPVLDAEVVSVYACWDLYAVVRSIGFDSNELSSHVDGSFFFFFFSCFVFPSLAVDLPKERKKEREGAFVCLGLRD